MNFITLADALDREAGEMRALSKRLRGLGTVLGEKLRALGIEVVQDDGSPAVPASRKVGGQRAALQERYAAILRAVAGGAVTKQDVLRAVAHAGIRLTNTTWGGSLQKLRQQGLIANNGGKAVHARFAVTPKGKRSLETNAGAGA